LSASSAQGGGGQDFKKIGYETRLESVAGRPSDRHAQRFIVCWRFVIAVPICLRFGFAGALGGAIGGLIAESMSKTSASSPPTMAEIGDVPEQLRALNRAVAPNSKEVTSVDPTITA